MSSKMNPQIRTVEIGVRGLEDLKLYPLSIADQLTMSELITDALQAFFNPARKVDDQQNGMAPAESNSGQSVPEQMKDIEFVSFMVDLIKTNISKILTLITDYTTESKAGKLLANMTNDQLVELVTAIYQMNYENSLKNGASLFEKIMTVVAKAEPGQQASRRPSQVSSNDMAVVTDSSTSSDSPSGKVD